MLLTTLLIFLGALGVAYLATPIARQLAWRTGLTDTPSARKVHTEPTPLLGGAAIYVAVLLALVLFGQREMTQLAGILGGATLVSVLGLLDDRHPLRPAFKLFGQIGAALVAVAAGVKVGLTGVYALDVLVSVVWITTITNAINFMDNMDGVSSGVAAIAAGAFVLLALDNNQQLVAPLAAAILGACFGFLVYNFNPASIFMGDGGSLFLGFTLAAIGIKLRFMGQSPDVSWLIPLTVLAVPLFDLTLVVVSRLRRRVNPFTTGGKDHLAHRLVRAGATPREAALSIYLLACASGGIALFLGHAGKTEALAIAAGLAALGAWGIWTLEVAANAARFKPETAMERPAA